MPLFYPEKFGYILVSLSANVSIPNVGNTNKVIFDQIEEGTKDFKDLFDPINGRVYLPFGYNLVNCTVNIQWDLDFTGGFRRIEIEQNGAAFMPSSHNVVAPTTSGQATDQNVVRPWVKCVGGTDYIQIYALQNTAGNLNILASNFTWFHVQATFKNLG